MHLLLSTALALPQYAQRSGRTCANCHVSPTLEDPEGWENPELKDRKCTLHCESCHTDPMGGGQRNASGRYYAQSTAGMFHTQDRSYTDHDRELFGDDAMWKVQEFLGEHADVEEGDRRIPSDEEEWAAGVGGDQRGGRLAWGKPLGEPATMQLWDGRYDDLNADPMLSVGGDVRISYWTGTDRVFPMQADLHTTFHPVHHLSLVSTISARGRSAGGVYKPPIYNRRLYVMAHELPYMAWAKAGIFQPGFGQYLDDHTRYPRAMFEQDLDSSDDTVLGAEIGAAPNYPYLSASVFANDTSWLDGGDPDQGWGLALNGGLRELAWTATGHVMIKQRGAAGRGDLYAGGVTWALNPFAWSNQVPLTFTGEVSGGVRVIEGKQTPMLAATTQMDWLLRNGVNARVTADQAVSDFGSPLLRQRYGLGLDLTPIPGITVSTTGRRSWEGAHAAGNDLMVTTHFYF